MKPGLNRSTARTNPVGIPSRRVPEGAVLTRLDPRDPVPAPDPWPEVERDEADADAVVVYLGAEVGPAEQEGDPRPARSQATKRDTSPVGLVPQGSLPTRASLAFIRYLDLEISLVVVAALLTVLGYSLNDTIVIFDRVRDNLGKRPGSGLRDTRRIDRSVGLVAVALGLRRVIDAGVLTVLLLDRGRPLRLGRLLLVDRAGVPVPVAIPALVGAAVAVCHEAAPARLMGCGRQWRRRRMHARAGRG